MKTWLSALLSDANWFLLLVSIIIALEIYFPETFSITHISKNDISGLLPLFLTIAVIVKTKKLRDKDNEINELKGTISSIAQDKIL